MIRRVPRAEDEQFAVIRNSVVRDERLSWRASGLLVHILSLPDDWEVSADRLWRSRPGAEGRNAVRAAIKELEMAGYVIRRKSCDSRGRWTTTLDVYDLPQRVVGAGVTDDRDSGIGDDDVSAGRTDDRKPGARLRGVGQPVVGQPGATTKDHHERPCREEERPPGLASLAPAHAENDQRHDGFVDWRQPDRDLFRSLIGGALRSHGPTWDKGVYTCDAMYEAYRQKPENPVDWPGQYLSKITDEGGLESWLLSQDLEIVPAADWAKDTGRYCRDTGCRNRLVTVASQRAGYCQRHRAVQQHVEAA